MALVGALLLTITAPTMLNPPEFYSLTIHTGGYHLPACELSMLLLDALANDDLVQIWMYLGAITVGIQLLSVLLSMYFRTYHIDECLSDMHFLIIASQYWWGPLGALICGSCLLACLCCLVWFYFTLFLIYNQNDALIVSSIASVILLVIFTMSWQSYRSNKRALKIIRDQFQDTFCDDTGDLRPDVVAMLHKDKRL